jgi:hypothetical protein
MASEGDKDRAQVLHTAPSIRKKRDEDNDSPSPPVTDSYIEIGEMTTVSSLGMTHD